MSGLNRRHFIGSALGGLAASMAIGSGSHAPPGLPEEAHFDLSSLRNNGLDTLFLTWQRDPTTTMTLQWVGPELAQPLPIYYSTVRKPWWQTATAITKAYPNTDDKVYRCELTGLTPGTEYQFQIGAGSTETMRFRTMPAKATDTMQFVSGGDAGIDVPAIKTNMIAARQEPWFALIGGDLAYDNGRSPKTFTQFLRNYRTHMVDPKGRLIPMISCIGNHEVDGSYDKPREKAPQYLSVFDGFFSEKTYGVLDIGDYMSLVLLDTGHIATIKGEQTDWLETILKARQERPHLLVANHVPAYPSYRATDGTDDKPGTGHWQRKLWSPLFENYKVDVVLEHHDHTFKRTHPLTGGLRDKNGVLYLGDGSWGKLRSLKNPEKRPYLAAYSSSYHMTVHRFEGDQRYHIALEESGRVADVCSTLGKRISRRG
jgi:hypothetical protein